MVPDFSISPSVHVGVLAIAATFCGVSVVTNLLKFGVSFSVNTIDTALPAVFMFFSPSTKHKPHLSLPFLVCSDRMSFSSFALNITILSITNVIWSSFIEYFGKIKQLVNVFVIVYVFVLLLPRKLLSIFCMERINKETLKVEGERLVETIKNLVKEGNVRRVIIKNEDGESLLEVPMTFVAIGVLAAPVVAAIGALAALVTNCTLEIERRGDISEDSSDEEDN